MLKYHHNHYVRYSPKRLSIPENDPSIPPLYPGRVVALIEQEDDQVPHACLERSNDVLEGRSYRRREIDAGYRRLVHKGELAIQSTVSLVELNLRNIKKQYSEKVSGIIECFPFWIVAL